MENLNKPFFNEISTTLFKNNIKNLYKEDEITSNVVRNLLVNSFNEKDFIKTYERIFGVWSSETRNDIVNDLGEFKSDILKIRESEQFMEKLQNTLSYFKEQSFKSDQKWEELKNKFKVQPTESSGLEDINLVKENLMQNKEEIKEILKEFKDEKILGEFGEMTLNQLVNKGIEVVSPIVDLAQNRFGDVTPVIAPLTLFFTFKSVVNLFDSVAYRDPPTNFNPQQMLEFRRMRSKELMAFMVLGAPFIAGSFYVIQKMVIPTQVNVRVLGGVNNESSLPLGGGGEGYEENKGKVLISIGLIGFIKNRKPKWLRLVILFICIYFSLYFFPDQIGSYNVKSLLLNNLIFLKIYFALGAICSFFVVIYYSLNIYFYILYSKNIFKTPVYLPQFILDWLNDIEKLSKFENKGFYIEFYVRLIFIYILIFILALSIFYWLN